MALDLNADISALRGAEYNPRHIGAEERELLKQSIREIGMVKPLIARNDTLVAGHQRTNALRELGHTRAPLYRLDKKTTVFDEIRFNQLHNGTDTDAGDENAHFASGFDRIGLQVLDPRSVSANHRGSHAIIRAEICQMILNFGPWGGCVATKSGKIIHGAQYAIAAQLTRSPLCVAVIPDELEATACKYLGRTYGRFSYDHLERKTYVQSMAQMFRLRDGESGKQNRSALYEGHVIPWLSHNPGAHVLDFGAGFGDYASALRGRGEHVHDVELFRRKAGVNAIDKRAVNLMIDELCRHLREDGLYDAVVLDAVMNSIDSLEAERHVLTCCNAFLRPGGKLFFSGRPREVLERYLTYTQRAANKRVTRVRFLDEHGFSASYRQGAWFYQRFHSKEDVEQLAREHRFEIEQFKRVGYNAFQVEATKAVERQAADVHAAIAYEFDLPWGSKSRIGRAEDVLAAHETALVAKSVKASASEAAT